MTNDLEGLIGPVALREFCDSAESGKAKLRAWCERLPTLTDDEFVSETASAVHGSALMQSLRGNHNNVHCQASACYHEAQRRYVAAGHADDCRGDTLYTRGFNSALRSQGHAPFRPPASCTCGRDNC